MRNVCLLAFVLGCVGCGALGTHDVESGGARSDVDPFIGTGGHGHTYPGASRPFGMVQLSPDTRLTGWDGCSGYHYSDSHIYGFSHTHLSGTGVSDYGDILLMPTVGDPVYSNGADDGPGYRSRFRKKNETASAGYYGVILDDSKVEVELTATDRCGFHRYLFPETHEANVIIDLTHRDDVIDSGLEVVGDREIRGFRRSKAWAQDQHVYFVARFSRPFNSHGVKGDGGVLVPGKYRGPSIKAHFRFDSDGVEPLLVKVGISAVDVDGARKNLDAEIPSWDFDRVLVDTKKAWDKQLAKIEIAGGSPEQRRVFHTAMYHSFLNPNLFMDVDGRYRGTDLEVHESDSHKHYTVFSLWDTYRATHPLFTILERERTNDFIRTFLAHYRDGGSLPIWELAGTYTGCMIGYHAVSVIADAYAKGIRDYDEKLALEAMIHSADKDVRGLPHYREQGFVPADQEGESVSKTLEYAYDDWCIAQMASWLGNEQEARRFTERAQYYKNVFDPSSGFMRAKHENIWFAPFDASEVNFHYTEANSWQYSLYVPQDVTGLMELLGGPGELDAWLDQLFEAPEETTGRIQPDISGLIGQYAHGNEPSHHIAYLYSFAGKPWKTQRRVRQILDTLYSDQPDGICGNEDCGQMSSWYVLSALGFYSVTPGSDQYIIGSPLFPEATLYLENGECFTIRARGVSDKNIYIQSATLNGESYECGWMDHGTILAGGELEFTMGASPNRSWGVGPGKTPVTEIEQHRLVPVPFVAKGERAFQGQTTIALGVTEADCDIYYAIDGNGEYQKYHAPFQVAKTTAVRAYATRGVAQSRPIEASFRRIPHNRSIELRTRYANQYSAGGDKATIDQIRGGRDFRAGGWQGYESVDFAATVDLGKVQHVRTISAGFLQEMRSWIWMPLEVEFLVSADGRDYRSVGRVENMVDEREGEALIREFEVRTDSKVRYVRVQAKNRGKCPDWHPGRGRPCWVFVDEITIR